MDWARRAVILGVFLLAATPARAWDYWLMTGAGCTPGDPAIQANRYFVSAGAVNYRAGASGLVTLYCPIAKPPLCDGNLWRFGVTYRDSDGAGNAVSVTAQVLQLEVEDGTFLGPVPRLQLSSNSSDVTVPTQMDTGAGVFPIDFKYRYHYVRVDMNRAAGTSHVATFYGAELLCFDAP